MKTRSFTLIELLIVLVIVGVLVTLTVPWYKLYIIKAKGAEAKRNVRALSDSVSRYYIETGHFPSGTYGQLPFLPPDLDTQVLQETKYFIYECGYSPTLPPAYLISASYIPWYTHSAEVPNGAIVQYFIFYWYDIPIIHDFSTGESILGEKLDAHWYRYYYHCVQVH